MSTERKNFWKMYYIVKGSKLDGSECRDPDTVPLEAYPDTPTFKVGDVVKLDKVAMRKFSDDGRASEGNYGTRFITPEDRLQSWDLTVEWLRTDPNAYPQTLEQLLFHNVNTLPYMGVFCKFTDRYTVVTPDCTYLGDCSTPRWEYCEVRNNSTGEQFVIERCFLTLA
jgi:hypothetical protein